MMHSYPLSIYKTTKPTYVLRSVRLICGKLCGKLYLFKGLSLYIYKNQGSYKSGYGVIGESSASLIWGIGESISYTSIGYSSYRVDGAFILYR